MRPYLQESRLLARPDKSCQRLQESARPVKNEGHGAAGVTGRLTGQLLSNQLKYEVQPTSLKNANFSICLFLSRFSPPPCSLFYIAHGHEEAKNVIEPLDMAGDKQTVDNIIHTHTLLINNFNLYFIFFKRIFMYSTSQSLTHYNIQIYSMKINFKGG